MKSSTNNLRTWAEGAIMVALAVVLNFFKIDLGPEGGSVNLVLIPLVLYSIRWGCPYGIAAGLVFGTLKAMIGGGIGYGWQSLLLDYSVAFGLVGLSGLSEKAVPASVIGAAGCLLSFVLSGVLVWGEYLPETFWGLPMANIWIYSLIYNGSFVLCNAIVCAVVLSILARTTGLVSRQKKA